MENYNGMTVCKSILKSACEKCAYFYVTKDNMNLCIKKEMRIHTLVDKCNLWMDSKKLKVKPHRIHAVSYEKAFHKTDNFLLREQEKAKKSGK